jgi:hypothetical protein
MTATLRFKLPEDAVTHQWAVSAGDMAGAITDALEQIRRYQKYDEISAESHALLDEIKGLLLPVADVALGNFP